MRRQHFISQIWINALLITFTISSTKAEIPFTEAKGIYAATKDEYKHISPFWAMVAIHGKLIERIRLYGFYKKKKDDKKIIDDALEDDLIAELLLRLFPSPDGTQLVANTLKRNIFGNLSRKLSYIDDIIQVLIKKTEKDKKITEVDLILKNLGKESRKYAELLVNAYEQQEIYANPNNPSQQRYPKDIVIIALLSFFVKVADHKSDLIDGLPSLFKDNIKRGIEEEGKRKEKEKDDRKEGNQVYDNYTKKDYFDYKKAQDDLFSSNIEQMITDPEHLEFIFFMVKGFEKYENYVAEPVGFRTGIKIKGAKEQFADCGETSLRNFFMLLLSTGNGGVVINDRLASLEKKLLKHTNVNNLEEYIPYKNFKKFITDHPDISEGASDKVHQAWAEVISKLNTETKPTTINHIQYGQKLKPKSKSTPYVYEIISNCKTTGAISIINMLNVIARIMPDKTLSEPWNEQNKNERYKQVEKKLNRLCKLFSRPKFKVKWKDELTGEPTINSDFMVIIFTINEEDVTIGDEDAFKWFFEDGHFVIKNSREPEEDWRIKFSYKEFTYPHLKEHLYYNEWLASMFPRPGDIEEEKQYAEKFPVTVIYNRSLKSLEGIKETIEIVLEKKMENFFPLISRWVQQSIQSGNSIFLINIINYLGELHNNLKEDELKKQKEAQIIEKAINDGLYIVKHKGILVGNNILALALKEHKLYATKTFIEEKINLDTPHEGNTPLHIALNGDEFEIANLLIDAGVDINKKDNKQNTPLHIAIFGENEDISKLLINKGADINEKNSKGNTPLHTAVFIENTNILELLIEKGANINEKNSNGNTPLHEAVAESKIDILRVLIEKGANMNEKNNEGNTPLHLAIFENNIRSLKLLIKKGANINEKNNEGNTPLHLAVIGRNLEAVYKLVDNGADVDTINKNAKKLFMSVVDSITEKDIKVMGKALQIGKDKLDVFEIIRELINGEEKCDDEDDEKEKEKDNEEAQQKEKQILDYTQIHNPKAYEVLVKFLKTLKKVK